MEKQTILYSVIIPCYNAAETIVRALDSIASQNFSDWEVVCIDDCSKDNTAEVIRTYSEQHKDAKIRLICNENNSGPGVSRNNGIAVAQGEFLCFLDADDYYANDFFEKINEVIAETDAEVILYGCNQVIGDNVRHRPIKSYVRREDYIALVGGSFWGGAWCRRLWENIVIPSISNAEDIAVIPVLISRAKKIVSIDDLLYNYVHSNLSISSRHNPQVSNNFVTSFHYTLLHIDVLRFHDSVEFHGIKTIIYGATLNALKAGMSKKEILVLWAEFEQKFPHWIENKYLKSYSYSKRIFVKMASHHCFLLMRCFAWLHNVLLKAIG